MTSRSGSLGMDVGTLLTHPRGINCSPLSGTPGAGLSMHAVGRADQSRVWVMCMNAAPRPATCGGERGGSGSSLVTFAETSYDDIDYVPSAIL
jgi:hypothetical protein